MPKKDIGDVVIGSILRHAVLGLLTGGVGNLIAAAVDVMDVMDVMDISDAVDASQSVSSVSFLHSILTLSSDADRRWKTGRTGTFRHGTY